MAPGTAVQAHSFPVRAAAHLVLCACSQTGTCSSRGIQRGCCTPQRAPSLGAHYTSRTALGRTTSTCWPVWCFQMEVSFPLHASLLELARADAFCLQHHLQELWCCSLIMVSTSVDKAASSMAVLPAIITDAIDVPAGVLRALQPARPTLDCLFSDPLRDRKTALKVGPCRVVPE